MSICQYDHSIDVGLLFVAWKCSREPAATKKGSSRAQREAKTQRIAGKSKIVVRKKYGDPYSVPYPVQQLFRAPKRRFRHLLRITNQGDHKDHKNKVLFPIFSSVTGIFGSTIISRFEHFSSLCKYFWVFFGAKHKKGYYWPKSHFWVHRVYNRVKILIKIILWQLIRLNFFPLLTNNFLLLSLTISE